MTWKVMGLPWDFSQGYGMNLNRQWKTKIKSPSDYPYSPAGSTECLHVVLKLQNTTDTPGELVKNRSGGPKPQRDGPSLRVGVSAISILNEALPK